MINILFFLCKHINRKRIHKKIILNKEQELYGPPAPLLDLLNPNQAKAVITTICEAHGTTFATANAYLENDQNRKKVIVKKKNSIFYCILFCFISFLID